MKSILKVVNAVEISCLFFALASCSSIGKSPIIPQIEKSTVPSERTSNHALWGYWQVIINSQTGEVQTIPIRQSAIHVNVVTYLQPPHPIGMGIQIKEMNPLTGDFNLIVSLTHPFNDASLTGFDVKGIFIAQGTGTSKYDSSLCYSLPGEPRLRNADGYTRWWNPSEFTTKGLLGYTEGVLGSKGVNFTPTLNAYKMFADDLGPDDVVTKSHVRGCFTPAQKTNSRRYLIHFPVINGNPLIVFNYAVDASWEAAKGDPSNLANFPLSANQPEPYLITYKDLGSTAFYHVPTSTAGGDLNFQLGIHKRGVTGNTSWVAEDLSMIVIESQTLFDNTIIISTADVNELIGEAAYFNVLIPGVQPTSLVDQEILVHAIMKEMTYNQGLQSAAPNKPLAAYQIFEIPILSFPTKPPAPTGLRIEATRNANLKLNGFKLDWNETVSAAEYVVYWSTDPYQVSGSLNFNVAPNGIVSEPSYQRSVSGSELNGQWIFQVTARSVPGAPVTESQPSTRAFIDFSGFEPYSEGANQWRFRQNSIRNRFVAASGQTFGVGGSGSLVLSPTSWFAGRSIAYCVTPALPSIPGANSCYIELAHKIAFPVPDGYAYSVCSTPTIQDPMVIDKNLYDPSGTLPDYMVLTDYSVDMVNMVSEYLSGYQMNADEVAGLIRAFTKLPDESGEHSDGWNGAATPFLLSRYSLPQVFSNNHKYVGVCFGGKDEGGTLTISPPQYPIICDEIAVAIY